MAIRFSDNTKKPAAILATLQVAFLLYAGWGADLSPIYFIFAWWDCVRLGYHDCEVDMKEPSSCAWFFHREFWYVGGSMVMGFAGEYMARHYNLETKTSTAS